MIRNILTFLLLCPARLSGKKGKAWDKEHQELLKPLGVKLNLWGACEMELTPRRTAELLRLLKQWRTEGARVNGFAYCEDLVDDGRTPVEWFLLDHSPGDTSYEHISWELKGEDVHLEVKADRLKPGLQVGGWIPVVCVSERFKAVVEAQRLTGIEFVWIKDVGKYQAPQWYLPVCQRGLGRGLDHAWIDTKKLSGAGFQTLDPRGRHGQWSVFAEQYKRDAGPKDPVVKKLLALLKSMELEKRGPDYGSFPRFLRKYLPDTDFAYKIRATYAADPPNFRYRGLAMNRKARDVLKANGVVTDDLCQPVLILDRPPRGVEDLDRRYGPGEPAFSAEEMTRMREREAAAWADHVAHPKLVRAPDVARSLSLLRSRKRRAAKNFARPVVPKAAADAESALGVPIPAAWHKVLRISNGGKIENNPLACGEACLIIPAEKLAKSQREEVDYYRDIGAELPISLLVVMQTEIGDSIWLDTARQKSGGDCRVVLMSHETGEEEREWPSVADFLEELLTAEFEDPT
jgi:hypothetical protein